MANEADRWTAQAIPRMLASTLVVLETRSGITGGVSAAAETADRMDATSAVLAVRSLTPFSEERFPVSIESLVLCYPRWFIALPARGRRTIVTVRYFGCPGGALVSVSAVTVFTMRARRSS